MEGRYDRQIPVFGEEGQARIANAVVGIAGCGGLGVNVITQLTAAGISNFVLCDPQYPDISNLNRQFIYAPNDRRPKAEIAAEWVMVLNPSAFVEAHAEAVDADNASVFDCCDIVVDCLDSFEARMVLSDYCEAAGKTLVHGGISGMQGQMAVCVPGETVSLRDMIGTMASPGGITPSVGAAVANIASMEALEVLKIVSGLGTSNAGKLITVDMSDWTVDIVDFGPVRR